MFPGGWPGAGLFVLRLAAAIPLIIGGGLAVRDAPQLGLHAMNFATIGVENFAARRIVDAGCRSFASDHRGLDFLF